MIRRIILTGYFIIAAYVLFAQTIEKIDYTREGNKLLVSYNITGAKFYQSFNIELYISFNNGKDFFGPLKAVEGDVGELVSAGKNKKIYWDVFREFSELKGEITFDIRAKVVKNIDKKFYVAYQGNNITPFGLKVGQLGLLGWYVSAFANTNVNKFDYEYVNEVVVDFPVTNYYEITDQKKYGRYSIVAGLNYQFSKHTYFNFGLGYGYKETIWTMDTYAYENNQYLEKSYVKNMSDSYGGLEMETGLMYNFNKFIIIGGINILNFNRLDWNIGVGYCF